MLKPITQPYAIDITDWLLDDEFQNYPEGTRPKTALFPPEKLALDFIKPSRRYLFKRSAKRYPDQFWGEVVAYYVGCMLGVEVPPAFAAYNTRNQYCGALIEWFYEDSSALFITGGHFVQAIIPSYDRKRGTQHNFDTVKTICRVLKLQDWLCYWGEVFLFDALIGNTDRHQENWGFLFNVDGMKARFSPAFDNGTGLGHERFTDRVANWQEEDFDQYICKGQHHMKWKFADTNGCGHTEMIKKIANGHPELIENLRLKLQKFSIDQLRDSLQYLETLKMPIPLSRQRSAFLLKLIELRHRKLCVTLNELY